MLLMFFFSFVAAAAAASATAHRLGRFTRSVSTAQQFMDKECQV
jgi:hypothetical protein